MDTKARHLKEHTISPFEGPLPSTGDSPQYETPQTSIRKKINLEREGYEEGLGDRLVPERGKDIGAEAYELKGKIGGEGYRVNLMCRLFGGKEGRVLKMGGGSALTQRGENSPNEHEEKLRVIYSRNRTQNFRSRVFRYIPQTPERILDAPDLIDDYYLNLLDWSSTNILTVALNQTAYLWNADSGEITQLTQTTEEDNIITVVNFNQEGTTLGVGTNNADVELWDIATGSKTRTLKGHLARVGSLAWNGKLLASGSRDSSIRLHDTRTPHGVVATLDGHQQEVCGLKWSLDGAQLASGGNDNLLHIWDSRQRHEPRLRLSAHTAAVKAIGWSPHQSGLLASGGGTADRTIRFWNTSIGECVNTIDTKSQICSMLWSVNRNELLTSHGYSENQLALWKYSSLKRIANLTGHSSRVLHLARSPNGETVVSAAGDETIRFWKCFTEEKSKRRKPNTVPRSSFTPLAIR
eukprot:TRINITY_DN6536_c2_g2_i1.p1 TRINITY_DN6536_c2_g2~~TRINITY_DN6536_c2_g2_i1.p1  ORF type:complete len:473 (+),score=52.66 TRINITY_DN6536_c2_g2_i1:23-1420(+)